MTKQRLCIIGVVILSIFIFIGYRQIILYNEKNILETSLKDLLVYESKIEFDFTGLYGLAHLYTEKNLNKDELEAVKTYLDSLSYHNLRSYAALFEKRYTELEGESFYMFSFTLPDNRYVFIDGIGLDYCKITVSTADKIPIATSIFKNDYQSIFEIYRIFGIENYLEKS